MDRNQQREAWLKRQAQRTEGPLLSKYRLGSSKAVGGVRAMAGLATAYDKFLYEDYKCANVIPGSEDAAHNCDLKIEVEPPILCHKEVISKSSKAIGLMISRPFREAETRVLDFSGEEVFTRAVIQAFVDFCYVGGPPSKVQSTLIPQLLYFAITFGVTRLVTALEEELIKNLSKHCSALAHKLFVNTIKLAQEAGLIRVEQACVEWGRKHFDELKTYGVLTELDKPTLQHLLADRKPVEKLAPLSY